METVVSIWMWLGFAVFIIFALSIDTFHLNNKLARPHESTRAAFFWVSVWICCALIFNLILWAHLYSSIGLATANKKALEFFTGYIIEESLSVDNLFVFYLVFHHFGIPLAYQQRVLSYGIWGAIIMRLCVILLGAWLISKFHWLLHVMGAVLVLTGLKIFFAKKEEKDLSEAFIIRLVKRFIRVTHEREGHHFFVRKKGLLYATPLFLALIFVEVSDLIFAFDSIPAIFAITRDPFIVWTSNIFAILGLRAMYFVLAGMVEKFYLLKYGIALILVFVGTKMIIEPWVHVSVLVSLAVIVSILAVFTYLSLSGRFVEGKKHGKR